MTIGFEIAPRVRATALAMGASGRAWLEALPGLIADAERRFNVTATRAMTGGTEAFVTEAVTASGETVILKCAITGIETSRREAHVLHAAKGRGYVTLLDADEANNILLLEKLGPQLYECGLSEDDQMRAICATLANAWMPELQGPRFATGADKAREFARALETNWAAMNKPCAERTVDVALSCAKNRLAAHDPAHAVLCHGDGHQWNTLQDPRGGFKFVDPDGVVAERAYDLAIPMREWPTVEPDKRAHAQRRCKLLAFLTGVDERAIWEWALLQLVTNTLCFPTHPIHDGQRTQLAVADAMAAVA
ncbi:MAG TPA: aminoglycoside phosphotransferase family protein [Rhizomicrobium sp.]|jgi:streptomycin 6-kinase|nr:aminoglycoside phosphotransferase family protein [Rhizomicrobium sp.]